MTSSEPTSGATDEAAGMDYTASLPAKRMAAAVLFVDAGDRVLLVEPAYLKTHWVM